MLSAEIPRREFVHWTERALRRFRTSIGDNLSDHFREFRLELHLQSETSMDQNRLLLRISSPHDHHRPQPAHRCHDGVLFKSMEFFSYEA